MKNPETAAALQRAAEAACRARLRAGLRAADAQDLAQEALVRALTSARPPAGVALAAWVYGIATNLRRDYVKSAKRREVVVDLVPEEASDDDVVTVLAVRRAVDELPEPLRDVVTLHELEDNSLRETADALQIPFDTAKDRLRRAREQLRLRLADADVAKERAHTRRRAAASGAAIVAAVYATLGDEALAAAAGLGSGAGLASAAPNATGAAVTGSVVAITARRVVPTWLATAAGGALLAVAFAVGRYTAPRDPAPAPPIIDVTARPDPVDESTHAIVDDATLGSAAVAPATPPRHARTRHTTTSEPAQPPVAAPAPAATAASATEGKPEHLLLDRARAGLRRGLHEEAIVTLMAHARQYPGGDLAGERDVLMIEAYLQAGDQRLARRRIGQYRLDHPAGVLRSRVAALAAELDREGR